MVYFFLQGSPLQFKVCAIFQLSIDFGERRRVLIQCTVILSSYFFAVIVAQRLYYGAAPPPTVLVDDDDLEQALALAEE